MNSYKYYRIGGVGVYLPPSTYKIASLDKIYFIRRVLRNERLVMWADDKGWHVGVVRNGKAIPFWFTGRNEPGYMWLLDKANQGMWQNTNFDYLVTKIKNEIDYSKEKQRDDRVEFIKREAFKPDRMYFA